MAKQDSEACPHSRITTAYNARLKETCHTCLACGGIEVHTMLGTLTPRDVPLTLIQEK